MSIDFDGNEEILSTEKERRVVPLPPSLSHIGVTEVRRGAEPE
jgi:hypothetical protein